LKKKEMNEILNDTAGGTTGAGEGENVRFIYQHC
jgi:hypothetical protein